jgi:hypothetical protein
MNPKPSPSNLPGLFALILFTCIVFIAARPAAAVRPFVTDDARVVGYHVGQLESSVKADKNVVANLNLFAFGPTENLELTAAWVDGFPHGRGDPRVFSVQGPLIQAKYLFFAVKPNGTPGLAVVVGGFPPWGSQTFKPDTAREFIYIAVTESLGDADRVQIHGNLGFTTTNPHTVATWGLGTQVRVKGGFNAIFEIFQNDPYAGDVGGAFQTGFRYIFNGNLQLDMTGGTGLWGEPRYSAYYGMGIRIVTDRLW